jgi:hypothetical protein
MRGEWQVVLRKMRPGATHAGWNLVAPEVVAKPTDEDLRVYLTKPISVVPLMGREKGKDQVSV